MTRLFLLICIGLAALGPLPAAAQTADPPRPVLLVRLAPSALTTRTGGGRMSAATADQLAAALHVGNARPLFAVDAAYLDRLRRTRSLLTGALPAESERMRRARMTRFGLDRWLVVTPDSSETPGAALIRLRRHPLVEAVELDARGCAAGWIGPRFDFPAAGTSERYLPGDPLFAAQWYLDQPSDADIDMPEAWESARSALDVPVAVLDSGLDADHPDLREAVLPGWDYVNDDDDPADDEGHGTHVTGLIAARAGNGLGVAGVAARTMVVPLKVLDADLWGYYSDWADALRYAADLGVRVVNLSAGGISPSAVLDAATAYASERGVVICTAMMNENNDTPYYPAACAATIAVGATDVLDRRAAPFFWGQNSGSCYGPHIDLVAPGDSLLSTVPGGYAPGGGTSQATPLVSAVSALMLHLDPTLTPAEVRSHLRNSADDGVGRAEEDSSGFDIYHGAGRLNAAAALLAVTGGIVPVEGFDAGPPRPNPSRGFVRLPFSLPAPAAVTLKIYDVRGRFVACPLDRVAHPAGTFTAVWYGADREGRTVPSGIYLWELTAGNRRRTGKLIRLR